MGNLRDQLKKAKLLSKKDAKRLAHEERVHRKEAGREGLEQEQEQRRVELEAMQQGQREQTKVAQAELDAARQAREEYAACEAILDREARAPARGGQRAWFFQLEDGRLPWLPLAETDRHNLLAGALVVVRHGPPDGHVYRLLPIEHAARVKRQLPERVVWAAPGAAI